MTTNVKLKEAYAVESKHGAFYTGGNVEWHDNHLYCQANASISVIDIDNGTVIKTIGEENGEDADIIQTFTTNHTQIVTSHKSGLLKLWNMNNEVEKMWKCIHKGPIAKLQLQGEQLASGGSDGVVRLWDLTHQACVASYKGAQGVINVVEFHPVAKQLFASGDDGRIISWGLGDTEGATYAGHFSKVTCICFHHDNVHFISAGRDKVVILWRLFETNALRTVPVYESTESIVCLPAKFKLPGFKSSEGGVFVATAGERGLIRVWDLQNSKEIYVQNNSLINKADEGGLAINKLLYNEDRKKIAIISAEHNIILHALKTFAINKQFIGFSDDILDVIYVGANDSHLAVATNSMDIKLYENATMNCQLLKGHTDIVLCLNKAPTNPALIVSSSKDNTIRVWLLSEAGVCRCVGLGLRHTGSVGGVCFSQTDAKLIASVSQDTCVKLWDLEAADFSGNAENNLICAHTQIAHKSDINCVSVSPNDKIIATASQDKTVKLWSALNLDLLGVLKGHKRGVWCVRFSPIDQVVLTSSADCSIKLWSINELNCLKSIQAHESSVIRAEFIANGMQIISAGADGLVKLFNLKSSECINTFEAHEARIWALTLTKDEASFVTAGSDSTLIKWRDITDEKRLERTQEIEEQALQEQQLSNYMQSDQLLKALKLALRLNKPAHVLKIINGVIKKGDDAHLATTIQQLRDDQKEVLLKCASNWNTNSRNCQPAQLVLNILINELQTGAFRPVGLSACIEGTLPYTERHFKRLTLMMQDLHFINYTINCMQPHNKLN